MNFNSSIPALDILALPCLRLIELALCFDLFILSTSVPIRCASLILPVVHMLIRDVSDVIIKLCIERQSSSKLILIQIEMI